MSLQAKNLTEFEWDAIIAGIRDQQCIFCIGPDVFTIGEEQSQAEKLTTYLKEHQEALQIRVQENGWFHLQQGGSDGPAFQAIRSFYKDVSEDSKDLLQKIAQIKLHITLSLTPDHHLREAFEEQNFPYRFDAYVRNEPDRSTDAPTSEIPLVYNLLGELGNRNSLVLTFDDFFDYFESVFKGNSMSSMLKNNILDAQYFVFIGIPFDQWFVHLFMRILNQHRERKTKFAASYDLSDEKTVLCNEQYNIKFVNSNITGFVEELNSRCGKAGLLKEAVEATGSQQNDESFFMEMNELLMENHFERLIEQLKNLLKGVGEAGRPLLIKVIQLAGRHNTIKEHTILGIIKYDEQRVETNLLRKDFMDLLNELKNIWRELNIQL